MWKHKIDKKNKSWKILKKIIMKAGFFEKTNLNIVSVRLARQKKLKLIKIFIAIDQFYMKLIWKSYQWEHTGMIIKKIKPKT